MTPQTPQYAAALEFEGDLLIGAELDAFLAAQKDDKSLATPPAAVRDEPCLCHGWGTVVTSGKDHPCPKCKPDWYASWLRTALPGDTVVLEGDEAILWEVLSRKHPVAETAYMLPSGLCCEPVALVRPATGGTAAWVARERLRVVEREGFDL
jgi:hypothetical protein